MPRFIDQSRVWIEVDGKPLEEYTQRMWVHRHNRIESRNVFVPAEPNKAFVVCVALTGGIDTNRRIIVRVDGVEARDYHAVTGYGESFSMYFDGWLIDECTTQRFTFGEINTSEVADCSNQWNEAKEEQIRRTSIEVEFYSAVVVKHYEQEPDMRGIQPAMAVPVHPDSKLASMVGYQIKPGAVEKADHYFTDALLDIRPGAVQHFARFLYRPKGYMVARGIIPNANARRQARDTSAKDADKRKDGVDAADVAAAAAASPQPRAQHANGESAEERRKRLATEFSAVAPEQIVDIDAPPKPRVFVDLETGQETVEEVAPLGEDRYDAVDLYVDARYRRRLREAARANARAAAEGGESSANARRAQEQAANRTDGATLEDAIMIDEDPVIDMRDGDDET